MKKFFLSATFFCIAVCISYAQSKADSLLKVLNSNPADTTRILTLSRLAEEVRRSNPDTALSYINEAIQQAEKLNFKKGWAAALNTKGYMLSSKSDFEGADQLHQMALKLSREINNPGEIARAYTGFGQTAMIKGEYKISSDNFHIALQYNLQAGNKRAIAGSYTNLAGALGSMSIYDSSIFFQLKSIEILESMKEHGALGRAYANLGAIFVDKEDFTEAFKYLELALKNSRIAGDKMHQSHILTAMGRSYISLKKYDDAMRCIKEAMQLGEETGRRTYIGRGFKAMGDIAEAKGNDKEAMNNYEQAYTIAKELRTEVDLIELDVVMAKLLNKSGKYDESLHHLQNALASPNSSQSQGQLMNIYEELYKTYSSLKDYKNGYDYLQLYKAMEDSIDTREKSQMIEDLKLQYETDKKDQEISFLSFQNKSKNRQSNLLILVSALLGVSLITLVFVFRQRMQISKLKEKEQSRLQLQSLRNDIAQDLHDDIGSTLSSISYYSEAIRQQVKTTTPGVIPLLEKMENASGYTINAMSDIVWAINATQDIGANLLNRMQAYATEMCSLKNISLEFKTDKSFETAKLSMDVRKNLYLIFKEAINNAVKYSECQNLDISIIMNSNHPIVSVSDNGKGFDTVGEFAGNGLKNMRTRAAEINGNLSIASDPEKGTTVILKL